MDESGRSSKLGATLAGLGIAAVAGAFLAKKARSAKGEKSIHDSWGESRSNRDRYPELEFLPEEEREAARAEMEANRIATGQQLLEKSMQQNKDSLLGITRNIV